MPTEARHGRSRLPVTVVLLVWAVTAPGAPVAPDRPPAEEIWVAPVLQAEFVRVAPGCFRMGLPAPLRRAGQAYNQMGIDVEAITADELPQHEVCLDGYWLGRHEVRVRDWRSVMEVPVFAGLDENAPASGVSWAQAREFVRRVNLKMPDRVRMRLPTEAEWEYACRAGTGVAEYPDGFFPKLDEHLLGTAWYVGSQPESRVHQPQPVGRLPANPWGFHDLLGNVWEWVQDGYHPQGYRRHGLKNPVGADAADGRRVLRGGSYTSDKTQLRCTNRTAYRSDQALPQFGVRLVAERGR